LEQQCPLPRPFGIAGLFLFLPFFSVCATVFAVGIHTITAIGMDDFITINIPVPTMEAGAATVAIELEHDWLVDAAHAYEMEHDTVHRVFQHFPRHFICGLLT